MSSLSNGGGTAALMDAFMRQLISVNVKSYHGASVGDDN